MTDNRMKPLRPLTLMYGPIFREKLEKLERRGRGHSEEAIKLRKALAQIDRVEPRSRVEDGDRPSLAAAE